LRIFEFIDKYCKDLVEDAKKKAALIDLSEFPHDGIESDIEGNQIPVVYVDSIGVPVSDFLTLDKVDFISTHKLPSAAEAYDNYVSALEIIEGEDVINHIRKSMEQERAALEGAAQDFVSMI
jgi:uncharacterized protein YqkB